MDENRNRAQQQDKRNQKPPQGNTQQSKRQWDGRDRRTGAERRHGVVDPGMQMNEGSSR